MKIIIEYEFELDGRELTNEEIENAFLGHLPLGAILSEDVDGTEDWGILLNQCKIVKVKRNA